ncbi:hypothetical protein VCHENC02_0809A, partial [Vibrio harveyi]
MKASFSFKVKRGFLL